MGYGRQAHRHFAHFEDDLVQRLQLLIECSESLRELLLDGCGAGGRIFRILLCILRILLHIFLIFLAIGLGRIIKLHIVERIFVHVGAIKIVLVQKKAIWIDCVCGWLQEDGGVWEGGVVCGAVGRRV